MMTYPLFIALGLLFLALSSLPTSSTWRIVLIVIASVAFLLAAVITIAPNSW